MNMVCPQYVVLRGQRKLRDPAVECLFCIHIGEYVKMFCIVIARSEATWQSVLLAGFRIMQILTWPPGVTDCHTSDIGHWFAMTGGGKFSAILCCLIPTIKTICYIIYVFT